MAEKLARLRVRAAAMPGALLSRDAARRHADVVQHVRCDARFAGRPEEPARRPGQESAHQLPGDVPQRFAPVRHARLAQTDVDDRFAGAQGAVRPGHRQRLPAGRALPHRRAARGDCENHPRRTGRHRRPGTLAPRRARHPTKLRKRRDEEISGRRIPRRRKQERGLSIMARVHNWQIGREMSYWYPENRPQKQFAAVFDINKCIACQTCTLACKTTWTCGKGQEYMLWNNVETKPYGFYPLAWDLKLLKALGPQAWDRDSYTGRTIFEAAPAGRRMLGWRPADRDYAYPNVGEDDCAGKVEGGASFQVPHLVWFFYLARICNHCTYPACLASCPRGSIYKRPEDGIVLVDQGRCRG